MFEANAASTTLWLCRAASPGAAPELKAGTGTPPLTQCQAEDLPVRESEIRRVIPVPAALMKEISERLILRGDNQGDSFVASAIDPPAPVQHRRSGPIPLPMLETLDITPRAFGVEERMQISATGNGWQFECSGGDKPSGAVLFENRNLPILDGLRLTADLRVNGAFRLRLETSHDNSVAQTVIDAPDGELSLPLPAAALNGTAFSLVLDCPKDGTTASIQIDTIRIEASAQPQTALTRSLWFWNVSDWQDGGTYIANSARKYGANRVYIAINAGEIASDGPASLVHALRKIRSHGIDVWAVEGDPAAVTARGRANFLSRTSALLKLNESLPSDLRLTGVQYDVEPYLLPGFASAPEYWLTEYVALIAELRGVTKPGGLQMDIAVPFWFSDRAVRSGTLLMDALADHVDSVTVMDYRTSPALIAAFAQPFLDWASKTRRDAHIALESVPLPDETIQHFRLAETGTAWIKSSSDGNGWLVVLAKPTSPPAGTWSYRFSHERVVSGSELSFHGRAPELLKLCRKLEALFSLWPSFRGLALHGLPQ